MVSSSFAPWQVGKSASGALVFVNQYTGEELWGQEGRDKLKEQSRAYFEKGVQHWLILGHEQHHAIDEAFMNVWQETMFPDIARRAMELRMVDRPC